MPELLERNKLLHRGVNCVIGSKEYEYQIRIFTDYYFAQYHESPLGVVPRKSSIQYVDTLIFMEIPRWERIEEEEEEEEEVSVSIHFNSIRWII